MKPEVIAERIAAGISHDLHEGLIPGMRVPLEQLAAIREKITDIVLMELTPGVIEERCHDCCDDDYYDDYYEDDECEGCGSCEYDCDCLCCDDPDCEC